MNYYYYYHGRPACVSNVNDRKRPDDTHDTEMPKLRAVRFNIIRPLINLRRRVFPGRSLERLSAYITHFVCVLLSRSAAGDRFKRHPVNVVGESFVFGKNNQTAYYRVPFTVLLCFPCET